MCTELNERYERAGEHSLNKILTRDETLGYYYALPRIIWRRVDGKMPAGRARMLENKSLHVEQAMPGDEGIYIRGAENDVGTASARASLTVHCKFVHVVA